MPISCATTLQECLHAAQSAQSIANQCFAIASNPATPPVNHIGHVIAVFSELGLGVSSAVLFDPLKWRARSAKIRSDAIARQDLMSQAKGMGWVVRTAVAFVTNPFWGFVGFLGVPILSIILGTIALFGMADLVIKISEGASLGFGIASFLCSLVITAISSTGKVEESLTKNLDTTIR